MEPKYCLICELGISRQQEQECVLFSIYSPHHMCRAVAWTHRHCKTACKSLLWDGLESLYRRLYSYGVPAEKPAYKSPFLYNLNT